MSRALASRYQPVLVALHSLNYFRVGEPAFDLIVP